MLVLSVSSIPSRFHRIAPTLISFLEQSVKVDKICVYIPRHYRRFPDYDGSLPEVPEGVEIRRVEQDFGPATKILHAVHDFGHAPDAKIIYADDDWIYPKNWARQFLEVAKQRPEAVVCRSGFDIQSRGFATRGIDQLHPRAKATKYLWSYRAQRIQQILRERSIKPLGPKPNRYSPGFVDIMEGYQGVLVRPGFFDAADFQIPEVCWPVDDIWLSAAMARKNIPIWLDFGITRASQTDNHFRDPLCEATFRGLGRFELDRAAIEHCQSQYGIWRCPRALNAPKPQTEFEHELLPHARASV